MHDGSTGRRGVSVEALQLRWTSLVAPDSKEVFLPKECDKNDGASPRGASSDLNYRDQRTVQIENSCHTEKHRQYSQNIRSIQYMELECPIPHSCISGSR